MTLLISSEELEARRALVRGAFEPLATSLAKDLATVMARPLYVPEDKAVLSREGGRCEEDGTMLDFDPFSPHEHRCPRCGAIHTGDLHDRFWIYWYQLWLAERAVHGAMLGRLGVLPAGTGFALSVIEAYCDRYPRYPNVDNALGPTRPFFSTYLESIWLLQLCVALDLLESSGEQSPVRPIGSRFRDTVVEPSRSLIHSYDEGMSNRQVWNNAALMSASRLLGRDAEMEGIIWSESGVVAHLDEGMLPDGTWYEGENYHLFAHRGLWYAVTMAERAGIELPPALVGRFDAGFATPFLTSLPDFTLPSRRDSQYAISLRQWRFAEMCEVGLARQSSAALASALSRLYAPDIPGLDTGRWRSSAEAERNTPATTLTRADLSWKSLLMARPEAPAAAPPSPLPSVLLEDQGIAVFRRNGGRVYVALDYGHTGGGHGHPDRLNLLLADGATRWLDDYGTGSYVDPFLHWYRSTLAHNAPLIGGRSQRRVAGSLLAFEDRGAAGWVSATSAISSSATVMRTVVVMPDYFVEELKWTATDEQPLDLPIHADLTLLNAPSAVAARIGGSEGIEDGFRFLRETVLMARVEAGDLIRLNGLRDGRAIDVWMAGDRPFEVWRATAPGAPGHDDEPFIIVRATAPAGTFRATWSWESAVSAADLFPVISIATEGERHVHSRAPGGWSIEILVGGAHSSIDLGGLAPAPEASKQSDELVEPFVRAVVLKPDQPVRVTLGSESYRRSEETWEAAGEPTAEIAFVNEGGSLVIEVGVRNADKSFVEPDSSNRLDNENADINGAGIQLYLRSGDSQAGYVVVPRVPGPDVQLRPIDGWGMAIPIDATWADTDDGYVVEIHVEGLSSGTVIDVDVIVNEKPAARERRRGQLVLSGGEGEFVYLRGDRHDPKRLIPMLLTDD